MFPLWRLDHIQCIPCGDYWFYIQLEIWYLGMQASACKTNGIQKTGLYPENHRVQTVENPPGEKLAANWNDSSFLIFNVFHHHCCCQSLLSIKLHKIQTLGNKHQRLSAYVKSQFFLYSNFAWKLLLVRHTWRLSPALWAARSSAAPESCQRRQDEISALLPSRCIIPQTLQAGFIRSWACVSLDKEFNCTYSTVVSTFFFLFSSTCNSQLVRRNKAKPEEEAAEWRWWTSPSQERGHLPGSWVDEPEAEATKDGPGDICGHTRKMRRCFWLPGGKVFGAKAAKLWAKA